MKKFVDNNYGKDMINTYRGLLFSNLERSRAKDIEDVEAMNFVPQAAYGLSFNPLEYGIIPEAKNDTGIKFGDVINGAVGTQMSRYFQYSPQFTGVKWSVKGQPGTGIRDRGFIVEPHGYAYACGGLKRYDGVNGSSTVNKLLYTAPNGYKYYSDGTYTVPHKNLYGKTIEQQVGKWTDKYNSIYGVINEYNPISTNIVETNHADNYWSPSTNNFRLNGSAQINYGNNGKSWFSAEQQAKIEQDAKDAVDETKPKQDITSSTGTGATNNSSTGSGSTQIASTSNNSTISSQTTPSTSTPSSFDTSVSSFGDWWNNRKSLSTTTSTPTESIDVVEQQLPLGWQQYNFDDKVKGTIYTGTEDNPANVRKTKITPNSVMVKYQRIPRKVMKQALANNAQPVVEEQEIQSRPFTDYMESNKSGFYNPTQVGRELMVEPTFACGGKKMALGGKDYMEFFNQDRGTTTTPNGTYDNNLILKSKAKEVNGRDNWWATDMALWDGAKLAANVYDAIQQNKQNNEIRSVDDLGYIAYADNNNPYLRGSEGVLGDRGDYAQGVVNTANMVKPYHQYKCGGKYQNGGVYDLTPDEIREIYANGGRVEFLD